VVNLLLAQGRQKSSTLMPAFVPRQFAGGHVPMCVPVQLEMEKAFSQ
jgi:hypothetical protein